MNKIYNSIKFIIDFGWLNKIITVLVTNVLGLDINSKIGGSLHFFIFDTIKILILLSIMIFIISYIRSYFPPERTKKIISKVSGIRGNFLASLLGIVTPFCSCSSVPLFIGFVEAGIPLGVTFSFLITSPIVNEAAVILLLDKFGMGVTILYVITGVIIGTVGGVIIGKLNMEEEVEDYVYDISMGETEIEQLSKSQRIDFAKQNVVDIIKRIWIYLIIGIGLGAVIHGWVPDNSLAEYAGRENPFAVIVAVVFGIPLYSNAVGTIPIAAELMDKGVAIGTALAFMMAVTALSLPEIILLRKVIKPRLITAFVIITGLAIMFVGFMFNIII